MERSILGTSLGGRVRNEVIHKRTGLDDAVERVLRLKWRWAVGHVARHTDGG